jgi:hypothetical protein
MWWWSGRAAGARHTADVVVVGPGGGSTAAALTASDLGSDGIRMRIDAGAGATIDPSMTFGYLAAHPAAERRGARRGCEEGRRTL